MRRLAGAWCLFFLALALPAQAAPRNIDYTTWKLRSLRPLPGTQVFAPSWSRDGRAMRFFVKSDKRNGGLDTLYTTDPGNGSRTRCLTCGLGRGFRMTGHTASHYAESPDGRWLVVEGLGPVVEGGQRSGLPCVVCADPGAIGQVIDSNIAVLELDRAGKAVAHHQLTFGGTDAANLRPTFTPDGKHVIWWANRGVQGNTAGEWKRWRIMIADFEVAPDGTPRLSRERVLIDRGGAVIEDGGITEDGRTYYFLKTVDQDPELFALDIRSKAERSFQRQVGWDEFPKPAPSGEVVYFMSDRAHANAICDPGWSLFRQTGEPTDSDFLTALFGTFVCGGAGELRPEQGPDGRPQVQNNFDAYLSDPDGRHVIRLTKLGRVGFAAWRPDSRELALNRSDAAGLDPDQIAIFRFGAGGHGGAGTCLKSGGGARGKRLGPARLGRTRARQRRFFRGNRFETRHGIDRYCVTGGGAFRIGYPTSRLNRAIGRSQRARVRGRALFVLTTSNRFSVKGVRPGAQVRALRRKLRGERRVRVGRDTWYLAAGRRARLLYETRGGLVRAVGIADKRLTRGRGAQKRFLRAWKDAR